MGRLHSNNPEDAAWRAQQARVDADIAGLSRDPELEGLVAEWDAAGLPTEAVIERIKAYAKARYRLTAKAGRAD
ncbi:MAG: hypothetical protein ACKVP7_06030 [Hyphomicrobiaceae bacterium]